MMYKNDGHKLEVLRKMKRWRWALRAPIIILIVFTVMISVMVIPAGSIRAKALSFSSDSRTSFSIQVILSDNLENESSNFFDLRMEPGQEQMIHVEIKNNTEEKIYIEVKIFTAFTNSDGIVDFGKRKTTNGSSLPQIDELVSTEPILELEAYEVVNAIFHIKMPEEPYNGILAGALNFSRVLEDKEEEREAGDGTIRNTYSFMTGIFLHQGSPSTPEILATDMDIELVNEKLEINTNFQNIKPAFAGALNIQTKISCKITNEVVFEEVQEGLQMAPNSNFNYTIKVDLENLQKENYIITHTLENRGEIWEFEGSISVDGEGILEEKESAELSNIRTINAWHMILIIALLLLIVGGAFYSYKKEKQRCNELRGE